jgi:hypothetical protein
MSIHAYTKSLNFQIYFFQIYIYSVCLLTVYVCYVLLSIYIILHIHRVILSLAQYIFVHKLIFNSYLLNVYSSYFTALIYNLRVTLS